MKISFIAALGIAGIIGFNSCSKCYTCSQQILIENEQGDTISTDASFTEKTCNQTSMEDLRRQGYKCSIVH